MHGLPFTGARVMAEERLLVDWKGLKAMGWPFSRFHTLGRMVPSGLFPRPRKWGTHRSARITWRVTEVLPYFTAPPQPPTSP